MFIFRLRIILLPNNYISCLFVFDIRFMIELSLEDETFFKNFLRMDVKSFKDVLAKVDFDIKKEDTRYNIRIQNY